MEVIIFGGVSGLISLFNILFMYKKEKKLRFEFDKKLNDIGYKKSDDNVDLIPLLASSVVDRGEYAARILLSMFPFTNLYPFIKIINKTLDKEYNAILGSLDDKDVLDTLEDNRYIYSQESILIRKDNLINKITEMNETDEPNTDDNESLKFSENDSLEQLKQKREMLDEMIYIRKIAEMDQASSYQDSAENSEEVKKEKQLSLISFK